MTHNNNEKNPVWKKGTLSEQCTEDKKQNLKKDY